MESFDDLGVSPELTEALAAEGIEAPTPLQEVAIPVIRKENHLVLEAGPGSGLLAAWCVGLLDRIEPAGEGPQVLVLCSTSETADRLAESVARLSMASGHTVGALGGSWVSPERADFVFGSASEVVAGLRSGTLPFATVKAVVIDQAQLIDQGVGIGTVEGALEFLPEGTQRILSALPVTPPVDDLVERLFKRTLRLPAPEPDAPQRGEVRFRIAPEPRETAALAVVEELLSAGEARHALVFCRNEDRAADVGDYLTLHGYTAGAPGDSDAPVWLGVDALEARASAKDSEGVVVVSCDVPAGPDTLDRRHSIGEGVAILLPREVAHFKRLGKRTGYATVPFPPPPTSGGPVEALQARLEEALEEEDIAPYLVALEPLFERHDPAEVAAAAVALMRKRTPSAAPVPSKPASSAAARATGTPSWAKLFIGVGERDGLSPGDLLGAITGEAGVAADAVGRIDIKESHSLVEVHDSVARQVIASINGTTIKGRAVRADFDRPRRNVKRPRR